MGADHHCLPWGAEGLEDCHKTAPVYIKVEGGDNNQAELNAWEEAEGVARGVIILSLHPTIAEGVDVSLSIPEIWKALKDKYGAPRPSGIYAKFQKVLALEVPGNADPAHPGKLAASDAALCCVLSISACDTAPSA